MVGAAALRRAVKGEPEPSAGSGSCWWPGAHGWDHAAKTRAERSERRDVTLQISRPDQGLFNVFATIHR